MEQVLGSIGVVLVNEAGRLPDPPAGPAAPPPVETMDLLALIADHEQAWGGGPPPASGDGRPGTSRRAPVSRRTTPPAGR